MIVASLYQMPVDPFEQVVTHRPLDYWGRNLHRPPDPAAARGARADDGVAYIMQLSIIGEQRTHRAAARPGWAFSSRVVDFAFFEFTSCSTTKRADRPRRGRSRTPTT